MVIANCHIKDENRSNIETPIEIVGKCAFKFKKIYQLVVRYLVQKYCSAEKERAFHVD